MLIQEVNLRNFMKDGVLILNFFQGLQEYVEALSFLNFIESETIISHKYVQEKLTFTVHCDLNEEAEPKILKLFVPEKEYILGLADLTGELMRYCIKMLSTVEYPDCHRICSVLKEFKEGFLSLGYVHGRELYNKIQVFHNSLLKVEEACYSLQLRHSELSSSEAIIPQDLIAQVFSAPLIVDEPMG